MLRLAPAAHCLASAACTGAGVAETGRPAVYGDVRPGKGLLSNDPDGFVLHRQGEGRSADPSKPERIKR